MIFIDTGAFLAKYLADDQYHAQSIERWVRLVKKGHRCFTSNFVLDETLTLLARRAGYPFAAQTAKNIFSSKAIAVLRPEEKDELDAVRFFEKYADQEVSFTDCVSFALMQHYKLKRVFSFDRHFKHAGFELWN